MNRWAWLIVMVVAIATRVWDWPFSPPGLNQDEASIGYEAFSMLFYGMDRHGYSWPVHLISWGSGQHILYAWFAMPWIGWFGLSEWTVRLPMLICGVLSVPLFALVMQRLAPSDPVNAKRIGAWSAWLLALSPWNILLSKWALESNLLPFVFLCAILTTLRWMDRPSWVRSFLMALSLAACLYTYSSAYLAVPILLGYVFIRMAVARKMTWKGMLRFVPMFGIMSFPMICFVLINRFNLYEFRTSWLSIPYMSSKERYIEYSIFSHSDWFVQMCKNVWATLKIMLLLSDGQVWNGLDSFWIVNVVLLPFMVLGFWRALISSFRDGRFARHQGSVLICWFIIALSIGVFAAPNINRLNLLFLPMLAFAAIGFVEALQEGIIIRRITHVFIVAVLGCSGYVYAQIVQDWPVQVGKEFHQGVDQAIEAAVQQSEKYAIQGHALPIVFEKNVKFAQIYTMFYLKLPPEPYVEALSDSGRTRNDFPIHYENKYWFEGNGPIMHVVRVSELNPGNFQVAVVR